MRYHNLTSSSLARWLIMLAASALFSSSLIACGGGDKEGGGGIEGAINRGRDLFEEDEPESTRSSKPPKVEVYTNIARADGHYTMVGHVSDDSEIRGVQVVAEFTCPGVEAGCVTGQKLRQIHDLTPPFRDFTWETTLPLSQIVYQVRAADEDGFGSFHNVRVARDDLEDDNHHIFEEADLTRLRREQGQLIRGNLYIEGLGSLKNLLALRGIERINGVLSIAGNTELESLDGLNRLKSVGQLHIKGNASLHDARALSSLKSADRILIIGPSELGDLSFLSNLTQLGSLFMVETFGITSLAGMSSLESLNLLDLDGTRGITSLEGLEGVARINKIKLSENRQLTSFVGLSPTLEVSEIQIFRNIELASLSTFPAEISALSELDIKDNDLLIDLEGLENLRSINSLIISQNSKLKSLSALSELEYVGRVSILKNENLSQCDAVAFAKRLEVSASGVKKNRESSACE